MKCYELTDDMWKRIETVLKKDKDTWRGKSAEKRFFVKGTLSLLINKKEFSTRLKWSDLNPNYGNYLSQCRKFNRWRNDGIWEKLLPIFAERANYSWIAELGTYEVLLKNGKSLVKINKAIKEMYDMEKDNLYVDIETEKSHNEKLTLEIEKLKTENEKKDYIISELKKENLNLKNGNHIKSIQNDMQKKLNDRIKENIALRDFNSKYITILYNKFKYEPTIDILDKALLDNFWSVAKKTKKYRERNQ